MKGYCKRYPILLYRGVSMKVYKISNYKLKHSINGLLEHIAVSKDVTYSQAMKLLQQGYIRIKEVDNKILIIENV